jgi:rhodanese-related sulfurtransferase
MPALEIGPNTTMEEILTAYPSARLELFRRYHVGGCAACGYKLSDTLEQVCREHEIPDALERIVEYIRNSSEVEAKLQVQPTVLVSISAAPKRQGLDLTLPEFAQPQQQWRVVDVRSREEWEQGHLPGAQLLTTESKFEMLDSWPKDTPILFYSNIGQRGLETASYFVAYGFTKVRNLAGGLRAWEALQSKPAEAEGGINVEQSNRAETRL